MKYLVKKLSSTTGAAAAAAGAAAGAAAAAGAMMATAGARRWRAGKRRRWLGQKRGVCARCSQKPEAARVTPPSDQRKDGERQAAAAGVCDGGGQTTGTSEGEGGWEGGSGACHVGIASHKSLNLPSYRGTF